MLLAMCSRVWVLTSLLWVSSSSPPRALGGHSHSIHKGGSQLPRLQVLWPLSLSPSPAPCPICEWEEESLL